MQQCMYARTYTFTPIYSVHSYICILCIYTHLCLYTSLCERRNLTEHQAVWDCVTWHQGRCCSRMHVALSVMAPQASGAVNIQKLAQYHR